MTLNSINHYKKIGEMFRENPHQTPVFHKLPWTPHLPALKQRSTKLNYTQYGKIKIVDHYGNWEAIAKYGITESSKLPSYRCQRLIGFYWSGTCIVYCHHSTLHHCHVGLQIVGYPSRITAGFKRVLIEHSNIIIIFHSSCWW